LWLKGCLFGKTRSGGEYSVRPLRTAPRRRRGAMASGRWPSFRRQSWAEHAAAGRPALALQRSFKSEPLGPWGVRGCGSQRRLASQSAISIRHAGLSSFAAARAASGARSGWTGGAASSSARDSSTGDDANRRCSASSTARCAGGRGQARRRARSCGASLSTRASGAASPRISCATPRRRDGSRGCSAERDPAPARPRRPRRHVRLPAGNRQHGGDQRGAIAPSPGDAGKRRAAYVIGCSSSREATASDNRRL
jgi:hypothetical protein